MIILETSFTSDPATFPYLETGYLDNYAFIILLSYRPSMWTSLESFPGSLSPGLFVYQYADLQSAYIGSAKRIYGKFTCMQDVSVGDSCSQSFCVGNTSTAKAGISTDIVEYSKIGLQCSQISEVKLLST